MLWPRPRLTIKQILAWADIYYEETGKWPVGDGGHIRQTVDDTWESVDRALLLGFRSLPRGGSLARLLAQHRGRRNHKALPKYTIRHILEWADAYHDRHVIWPHQDSGQIEGTRGETWHAVNAALSHGGRGLPGGSSLKWVLAEERNVFHPAQRARFSARQILAWADAYHQRTGMWPTANHEEAGPGIGVTWLTVDKSLKEGLRGLRGGESLAGLLAQRWGVKRHYRKPPLSLDQILLWADAHKARTGQWPDVRSGRIPEAAGESRRRINVALCEGKRGLPKGKPLTQVLAQHRGRRSKAGLPKLSVPQILAWADAHFAEHGKWPGAAAGEIQKLAASS